MATLVSGPSLGTAFHEWMHSWYQMILGTNESLYAWMDEGFTSYAEDLVSRYHTGSSSLADYKNALVKNPTNETLKNLIQSLPEDHAGAYANYFTLAKSGQEEPMTTHADHYNSNFAYSIDAYSKGEVFMEQLGYIIGAENRDSLLLEYYRKWRFKHPEPADLMRIAERKSGLELDWYREYWVNSTKTIDYAIDSLWEEEGMAKIRLKRIGLMPMPIDLRINFKDGSQEMHNIPLNLMYGNKPAENKEEKFVVEESWKWTHPTYTMTVNRKLTEITKVEIDPTKRMADVARKNNLLELNW
jgi:aminopeptidase N